MMRPIASSSLMMRLRCSFSYKTNRLDLTDLTLLAPTPHPTHRLTVRHSQESQDI